ncbi:hypothetical protein [Hydrogenophaga sp.]|uniref:hypothetical protein n=1 Tax=Hydrogenophaga sp. TaxID=1904254 RepID=UPI00271B0E94|nr:hypothetical protein [Hydrogenophaga sp.]MDO9434068.1 hypothetical protein [Hydrogenophaga sp.]
MDLGESSGGLDGLGCLDGSLLPALGVLVPETPAWALDAPALMGEDRVEEAALELEEFDSCPIDLGLGGLDKASPGNGISRGLMPPRRVSCLSRTGTFSPLFSDGSRGLDGFQSPAVALVTTRGSGGTLSTFGAGRT